MGNPSAAHEPSMEEILASIRQIISEDGDQPEDGGPSAEAEGASASADLGESGEAEADSPETQDEGEPSAPSQEEDAARLDEGPPVAAAAPIASPEAPQPQRPEPILPRRPGPSAEAQSPPGDQSEPTPPPAAVKPERQAAGQGKAAASGSGGLSASAMSGADDHRLLSPQADDSVSGAFSALAHTILAQNARTLEDLVSEMLRPMLKDWLDDNLPPLVERLVKEEIERVSRGRR